MCRDKLEDELQELDVVMGLVTINPRYSPILIQEQSMATPMDTLKTAVRLARCPRCQHFPNISVLCHHVTQPRR